MERVMGIEPIDGSSQIKTLGQMQLTSAIGVRLGPARGAPCDCVRQL
jgi:hypothetical protein